MTRYYSATAQDTYVTSPITSGALTVIVAAVNGYPSSYPFVLALDYNQSTEELVQVTGVSGVTLTIIRGFNGTTAVGHAAAAVVRHVITAQDMTDGQTHYAATTSVHGIADTSVLVTKGTTTDLANVTSFLFMGAK
jgi:hypothetical protein